MTDPMYRRATWTAFGVAVCIHASAIAPVIMFSTTLLIMINQGSDDFALEPRHGTILIGVTNLLGACFSIIAFKYLGRRTNLLIGFALMMCVHLMTGIFLQIKQLELLFVMLLMCVFMFQIFLGTMSFLYPAEVCVDTAQGIVLSGLFLAIILITGSMHYMIDSPLGFSGTFWFYAFCCFCCVTYTYLCVKETKGLSAMQLKQLYWPEATKTPEGMINKK